MLFQVLNMLVDLLIFFVGDGSNELSNYLD